jgi:hypothetical protein
MRQPALVTLLLVSQLIAGCFNLQASPAIGGPPPEELTTEQLLGFTVASSDGATIGPFHGIVMDISTGTAHYVVVLIEDRYHYGKGASGLPQDQFLLVPWSHLRLDMAKQSLIANVNAATLEQAPVLDALPDTTQPNWNAAIRRFWAEL